MEASKVENYLNFFMTRLILLRIAYISRAKILGDYITHPCNAKVTKAVVYFKYI